MATTSEADAEAVVEAMSEVEVGRGFVAGVVVADDADEVFMDGVVAVEEANAALVAGVVVEAADDVVLGRRLAE